jgi:hypothetical protein
MRFVMSQGLVRFVAAISASLNSSECFSLTCVGKAGLSQGTRSIGQGLFDAEDLALRTLAETMTGAIHFVLGPSHPESINSGFVMSSVSDTPRPNATVHPRAAPTTIARNATRSKSRVFRTSSGGVHGSMLPRASKVCLGPSLYCLASPLSVAFPRIPKDSSPKGSLRTTGPLGR